MKLEPCTSAQTLRLLPLGGLGEIGLNLMALECAGKILLIDCGLMFPEATMLGVDLVLPDITVLEERSDDILGLLLTHGHEDHIGALPYLWERIGEPTVYGTTMTLGLVSARLEEHQLKSRVPLVKVDLKVPLQLGPFEVEFFRAAHSIVDGAGLGIRTPAGRVVHTGDFKLDATPVDGETTDLARLAAYGEEGVLLLLSDSTNVERSGFTLSERVVGEAFDELLRDSQGRVLVATFSSNIHRIQQLCDAAAANRRRVVISGRSMEQNVATARKLGFLKVPDNLLLDLKELPRLRPEETVILTTGSQGEPLSSLSRIAMDDHKQIRVAAGDTVILSARSIPGNERAIATLINHLYRRGAEVHYERTSEIHVSGHASQEELKLVLGLTRPRYFVPIHGEYRHLVKHAALARELGIPQQHAVVLENGQPLKLSDNGLQLEDRVASGRVFVDGKGVGDIGDLELRDRSHLAHHGLVVCLLALEGKSGRCVYGPELLTRGFIDDGWQDYLEEARQKVLALLEELSPAALADQEELRVEVRRSLKRYFSRTIDRRPLILPVIMEL
ncbi:MAG: ribonuclease J [Desulfuromonas sp.]|nr:MAG: ribonuclease J [Desulfuromonas sp.]